MRIHNWLFCTLFACAAQPLDPPTEEAVAEFDRDAQPPLYQMLYTAPILPESNVLQQKLRILIWLRHMGLNSGQLQLLEELRQTAQTRRAQIIEAEKNAAARYEAQEREIHQELWDAISSGTSIGDQSLAPMVEQLEQLHVGGERESQLLSIRVEGIRSIMDAESTFLRSLSPDQEAMLVDSLFLLRNQLDPVGNPGDYRALVGTTYDPGQYAVLTRGIGAAPLNIGGLWSDDGELSGRVLHEARKEVLLYLVLMEPALDQAIAAAEELAASETP